MKAVMWTDTLQVIIMYAAMIAVGKQPLLYIKKNQISIRFFSSFYFNVKSGDC